MLSSLSVRPLSSSVFPGNKQGGGGGTPTEAEIPGLNAPVSSSLEDKSSGSNGRSSCAGAGFDNGSCFTVLQSR